MTIEISDKSATWIYRINPYNDREIDRKRNVHNARWERCVVWANAEDARRYLLRLSKESKGDK